MTEPAWGDHEGGEHEPEGEHVPDAISLGNGLVLHVDAAKFRRMMNSAPVRAAVDARGRRIAQEATSAAVTPGAVYEYVPSADPNASRARGIVRAANYKAVVDDQHHSTLLKAVANNTDPKPDVHEGGQPVEVAE